VPAFAFARSDFIRTRSLSGIERSRIVLAVFGVIGPKWGRKIISQIDSSVVAMIGMPHKGISGFMIPEWASDARRF
jgi:hypothetical protein